MGQGQKKARGAVDAATQRILLRLGEQLDDVVEGIVEAVWRAVPAYAAQPPALKDELRVAGRATCRLVIDRIGGGAAVAPDDVRVVRWPAARQPVRITPAELLRAHHVAQAALWSAIVEIAGPAEDARSATAAMADQVMHVAMTSLSVHLAAVQRETDRLHEAEDEQTGRSLLDHLLGGVVPTAGAERERLRRAGLDGRCGCLVICATTLDAIPEPPALRRLAAILGRSVGGALAPLSVVRADDVVVVAPVGDDDQARAIARRLAETTTGLAARHEHVAVGVSTRHDDLGGVPVALHEALGARARANGGGVVALCDTSAVEYLMALGDETAYRLVRPDVRAFIEDDQRQGGELLATLAAYVEADLNATQTAERLHMHVNTVRYRLSRIEERTGCELRRFGDVLDLLVAGRLCAAHAPQRRATDRAVVA